MAQKYYGNVIYTDGTSHDWFGAKIIMRDEPINGQNASKVYWDYYVWMTKSNLTPYKYKYGNAVSLIVDGKTVVSTDNYGAHDPTGHVGEENALLYASGSTTIEHNADGTKTFMFAFTYDQTQTSTLDKVVIQGTYTCAPIVLSSTLIVNDGILGKEQSILISRPASGYTDTITYTIGGTTGIIADRTGAASVAWTPSLDIATTDISKADFECIYTITTYNGSTLVGTTQKAVTLSLPASASIILPDNAVSVIAMNAIPALAGVTDIIATKSYIKVQFNSAIVGDEYGASITSVSATYNGETQTGANTSANIYFLNVPNAGTNAVTYKITNSRGRVVSGTVAFEVLPYNTPYIASLTAQRCNVNGDIMPNGSYIKIAGTPVCANYGKNTVNMTFDVYRQGTQAIPTVSLTTLPCIIGAGMVLPQNAYSLNINIKDSLYGEQTYVVSIPDESIPFHIKANGKAVGIGAYALDDGTLNIGYDILKDGVPFGGGGGGLKKGTITVGQGSGTCYYIKGDACAFVFVCTGYLMTTGGSSIVLPEELHKFTGGAIGSAVIWATGSFSSNVTLTANTTTQNSLNIIGSGMGAVNVNQGMMLVGMIALNY